MALDLKKAIRKSADHGNSGAGGYVKTTTLRDYPVVAIRVKRFGERPGYQGQGIDDYVIGDFIALDSSDKVVLSQPDALWGVRRGDNGPGACFRIFDTTSSNYVLVVRIKQVQSKKGNMVNVADDISDSLTQSQLVALEAGFNALVATSPEQPTQGWGNTQDDPGKPPY